MTTARQRVKVAVLISGRGSNLQSLIDACAAADFPAEIVHVISNRPGAYGLERARSAGIETSEIDHKAFSDKAAFEAAVSEVLGACSAQLVCLAGFMRILSAPFVEKWRGQMLNIHPSLLPSFKGLHTHQRTLDAGVKIGGCSVHFVVPEMDAGPIIVQAAVPVLDDDTADSLAARILQEEHRIYPMALGWVASGAVGIDGERVIMKKGPAQLSKALISPTLENQL